MHRTQDIDVNQDKTEKIAEIVDRIKSSIEDRTKRVLSLKTG